MEEIKGWLKKTMQETDLKQKMPICIFQSDFLQNLFQKSPLNTCFAIPFSGISSGGHVSQAPPETSATSAPDRSVCLRGDTPTAKPTPPGAPQGKQK